MLFCLYIIHIYFFRDTGRILCAMTGKQGLNVFWILCNAITMSLQICKYAALMIKDEFIIEFKKMYSNCKWCLSICDTVTACCSLWNCYRWLYNQSKQDCYLHKEPHESKHHNGQFCHAAKSNYWLAEFFKSS